MASLGQVFDVNDMPTGSTFEVLPEGWYQAAAGSAELKLTKAGDGQYIAVKWTIEGPSYQGRVVFGNITVRNPSSRAEDIGREQMGQLMRSAGMLRLMDTDQIVGIRCEIKLKVREDKSGQYGPQNDVVAFRAIEGATLPKPSVASTASAMPKPATVAGKPPWA